MLQYEEAGQYARMRTEQAHARRVASQLRSLLGELEALRRQVQSQDVASFDRLTQRSRDLTLRAIMDYLGKKCLINYLLKKSKIQILQVGTKVIYI